MDTAFKRCKNVSERENRANEVFTILSLSIFQQFTIMKSRLYTILSYLDSLNDSNLITKLQEQISSLDYNCNEIEIKKSIVSTFYKYEKYYLD